MSAQSVRVLSFVVALQSARRWCTTYAQSVVSTVLTECINCRFSLMELDRIIAFGLRRRRQRKTNTRTHSEPREHTDLFAHPDLSRSLVGSKTIGICKQGSSIRLRCARVCNYCLCLCDEMDSHESNESICQHGNGILIGWQMHGVGHVKPVLALWTHAPSSIVKRISAISIFIFA